MIIKRHRKMGLLHRKKMIKMLREVGGGREVVVD